MADVMLPVVTFVTSGTYSSSSGTNTGTPVALTESLGSAEFMVRVTNAPSSSAFPTNTLDVYLQHSVDYVSLGSSVATWDDFLHFPQMTAGALPKSSVGSWNGKVSGSSNTIMHTVGTAALAANTVINGAVGSAFRAQAVIASSAGTLPSSSGWQFSVIGQFYR